LTATTTITFLKKIIFLHRRRNGGATHPKSVVFDYFYDLNREKRSRGFPSDVSSNDMKYLVTLILIFISSWGLLAFARLNAHPDHELIAGLVCLEKENPAIIEEFFRSRKINDHCRNSENYGFGFRMERTQINGEHIVIA
jgi:hypothetical protein